MLFLPSLVWEAHAGKSRAEGWAGFSPASASAGGLRWPQVTEGARGTVGRPGPERECGSGHPHGSIVCAPSRGGRAESAELSPLGGRVAASLGAGSHRGFRVPEPAGCCAVWLFFFFPQLMILTN